MWSNKVWQLFLLQLSWEGFLFGEKQAGTCKMFLLHLRAFLPTELNSSSLKVDLTYHLGGNQSQSSGSKFMFRLENLSSFHLTLLSPNAVNY